MCENTRVKIGQARLEMRDLKSPAGPERFESIGRQRVGAFSKDAWSGLRGFSHPKIKEMPSIRNLSYSQCACPLVLQ